MISTSALLEQLALFVGWGYSLTDPRYPAVLPGVRLPASPPNQTNCCAFVEGLIVGAAARAGVNVPWNLSRHGEMMIDDIRHRLSPVEALTGAGLADHWPLERGAPPPWSVVQGWRGHRGHTFIIRDTVHNLESASKVLILEANRAYGVAGVGWRGHGNIESSTPPALWFRDSRAWTWDKVRATYRDELGVAAVRVSSN